MNKLVKWVNACALGLALVSLNACFDNDNKNSFDEGPAPLDVNVSLENTDEDAPVAMKLRAAPHSNSVSLDWDAVKNAADYRVSRQIEGSSAVVETTGGVTSFSFVAQASTTYKISVSAIDSKANVISMSKVIKVNTPAADALKMSDEGL